MRKVILKEQSILKEIFSDLAFVKKAKWLEYGKFRMSYATSGKAPYVPYVIDYSFGSQITTGGGYALGVFGNNFDLQPEFSKNFEIGGELQFLKRRELDLKVLPKEFSITELQKEIKKLPKCFSNECMGCEIDMQRHLLTKILGDKK